jgi:IS30 family transposase
MKMIKLKQPELPPFLPHGWVSEVAKSLGVCRATISRNVKRGNGLMYDKIVKTAAHKYGKKEVQL